MNRELASSFKGFDWMALYLTVNYRSCTMWRSWSLQAAAPGAKDLSDAMLKRLILQQHPRSLTVSSPFALMPNQLLQVSAHHPEGAHNCPTVLWRGVITR
jgi:hypothetical protein